MSINSKTAFAAAVLALASSHQALGQSDAAARFDATSIKHNNSGEFAATLAPVSAGRFTAINVPLRQLIARAYGYQGSVEGAPRWIDAQRFDIVATISGDTRSARVTAMLRNMLAERFKLAVHTETRERPVYALTLATAGKLGPQLQRSSADCGALLDTARASARRGTSTSFGELEARCATNVAAGRISARGIRLAQLVPMISRFTDRVVIDRSGLDGAFDLDLTWTPDRLPIGPAPPGSPTHDTSGAALVTAMREQLGLRLEPRRGPVDVLVIDRVELPSEN
jgi:uncharacterized protein (TIGR03435 family)